MDLSSVMNLILGGLCCWAAWITKSHVELAKDTAVNQALQKELKEDLEEIKHTLRCLEEILRHGPKTFN